MDLRLGAATAATDAEREAVASVLGPPESGWDGGQRQAADGHVAFGGRAARQRRHLLMPVLHAVQERIGWISPGALDHVCERLTVPPAEAYGVASFYALFRTTPSPGTVVHVCDDIACQVNGAERLCEQLQHRFGAEGTETAYNGTGVTWQRSPCLGQCERGSAALIQRAGADPARTALAPAARRRSGRCGRHRWAAQPASRRWCRRHDGTVAFRIEAAAAGRAGSIRPRWTPTGPTAGMRCCGAPSATARRACCAKSRTPSCSAAAARRSPPRSSGKRSPPTRSGRTTSSATPTNPSRARSRTGCSSSRTRTRWSRR